MATVGRSVLTNSAMEWFEGLRTFDAERACAVLADNARVELPWAEGPLLGKEATQAFLSEFLADTVGRSSMSIVDVAGRLPVVRMTLSVSGRFGRHTKQLDMTLLVVKDQIHEVRC